jgi:cell fate regulator YaaT (PSP1 superfamily)
MGVRGTEAYRRGMEVIVRSNRGLEVGQVLCEASDDALSHLDDPPTGQILREVSSDDANEVAHLDQVRQKNMATCQKYVDQLSLDLKLVDVEQLFGGERMIVYYLAEERVDFRELVKLLAGEFQTRVEMKQIGVRDEAKLLADYGDCGQPVCCNNHLVTMPPVSMRMAKLQKATLDPTKISGRCGRLKCCLRYEFDNYDQIQKSLPKVGSHVVTQQGKGKVIGQQLLMEQLLIETEDHRRILIDAGEVLSVMRNPQRDSREKKRDVPTRDDSNLGAERAAGIGEPELPSPDAKIHDRKIGSTGQRPESGKSKSNQRRSGAKKKSRRSESNHDNNQGDRSPGPN